MSNQLYYGDNLDILRRYIDPESVDLCYIDPPFNSNRNYNQIYTNTGREDKAQAQAFIDTWTWDDFANKGLAEIKDNYHGHFTQESIDLICGLEKVLKKSSLFAYLVGMTLRIAEIHRVLKPTGSFYLHCDPTASHYLKLVLDAIFCSQGGDFRNEIIWWYETGGIPRNDFARKHDIIFRYVKSKSWIFNANEILESRSDEVLRRIATGNSSATRSKGETRHPSDVLKISSINAMAKERLGYPTQKPEALLERIIKASSNEGDVILDAFCGCGTTIAVAQRLNRQWIGIDITYQSIGLVLKRLTDTFGEGILETIVLNGVPQDVAAAEALALKQDDRTRKEFEKWAVLTYTNNKAIINDKKGAHKGIDGIVNFQGDKDREKMILQVKSGKVSARDIRDLQGTMTLNDAPLGIFITLKNPTRDMIKQAKEAGIYQNNYIRESIDKITIVCIEEIIENKKRLDLKMSFDAVKSAEKQQEIKVKQNNLEI